MPPGVFSKLTALQNLFVVVVDGVIVSVGMVVFLALVDAIDVVGVVNVGI